MTESHEPRPLHLHTVESLCKDLISGRAVGTGKNNEAFSLESRQARAILNWYSGRSDRWASSVQLNDIDAIVDASLLAPPELPGVPINHEVSKRRLRLAKITAHRFGGLHAYSVGGNTPEKFEFEPKADISLFEGWNGSGKTSILNAVIWCLTGQLLRPQRKPEPGNQEFDCHIERESENDDKNSSTTHSLTPVTPLPDPEKFKPDSQSSKLPIDTWVELIFADEDGSLLPPLRRSQSRTTRGTLQETEPDISALGLDPIAVEVGTAMPGMIPFIQLGGVSELGKAIAQLTGLSSLVDLSKHSQRAHDRIKKDLSRDRQDEIAQSDSTFNLSRDDLTELIAEQQELAPASEIPKPSYDKGLEAELVALDEHFQGAQSKALSDAKTILGNTFDPTDREARADLEENLMAARGKMGQLSLLPSAARLSGLASVDSKQLTVADKIISEIVEEARELAELAKEPSKSRRLQLYARVANWMKTHDLIKFDHCAVCKADLSEVHDDELGGLVQEHLKHATEVDSQLIGQTLSDWVRSRMGQMSQSLAQPLAAELRKDLPQSPGQLIAKALSIELFDGETFNGALSGLHDDLISLCTKTIETLPQFSEPKVIVLATENVDESAELEKQLNRLSRAVAFARWRHKHVENVKKALEVIVGKKGTQSALPITADSSLLEKLAALETIVANATPTTTALSLCGRMTAALKIRRAKEKRLTEYNIARQGLLEVVTLGSLAEAQVEELRRLLQDRANHWRGKIYSNAYSTSGHSLAHSAMDSKGALTVLVGSNGASAPAQHISNASALRATLFGFFLAFWEYVLKERGGLKLLILDDPQELLDNDNRDHLARSLPKFVEAGAQVLVTTYDRLFARTAVSEGRKQGMIEHRSVHPVNVVRSTVEVAPAIEELDRKRLAFESSPDDALRAQDYASEIRAFVEARLADLFDDPAYPAFSAPSSAPTFMDHMHRLRGLVRSPPNELFRNSLIRDFAQDPALRDGAPCLVLINKAHHQKAAITYNEVYQVKDDLRRARSASEALHEEFRRWRWREPAKEGIAKIVSLAPSMKPKFEVDVHPDLAAFTGSIPSGGSQDISEERLGDVWFDDKAFYYVRNENLGFSAPAGSVVIVECTPKPGNDRNLVIARRGDTTLARRLLRPKEGAQFIALAAQTPDPRKSPPTVMVDPAEVQIHRIVGVLFENIPPPKSNTEAVQVSEAPGLAKIETAYRVRAESALPLALPGQLVLGGPRISADELNQHEGQLVALTLADGQSIFKRIGPKLSGPLAPTRLFESIGGLGASEVILTEPIEGFEAMPHMLYARAVLGVLYE